MPRMHLDIDVCLGVNVLDLVDPWLEFSVFEDRKEVAGRVQGHGRNEHGSVGNTSRPRRYILSYALKTRVSHCAFHREMPTSKEENVPTGYVRPTTLLEHHGKGLCELMSLWTSAVTTTTNTVTMRKKYRVEGD